MLMRGFDKNQETMIQNGIKYSDDAKTLVKVLDETVVSFVIPRGITKIGRRAFADCKSLKSVYIPDSVIAIGEYAFSNCKSLKSISIPGGITHIENQTFQNCSALCSVYIPDSVVVIGEYAFAGCTSLKTICLPNSCKELKKKSFAGCSSLQFVIMPEGIKQIWGAFSQCISIESIVLPESTIHLVGSVFWGCSSLLEIKIPKNITDISWATFIDCHSLQSFIASKNNPVYSTNNGILFSKSKKEIVRYPPAKIGSTYIIPNEIEHISHCAFQGCKNLQTLILNSNVISIEDSAFSSCSLLTSVFLPNSIKNIGSCIFKKCNSLATINCNIENINEISLCPDAFDGIDYKTVKLIIPENTKKLYTSHPSFSKFSNIVENKTIFPTTGISKKKSVNQLSTELNFSYLTFNEELRFLDLPEVSLGTRLDMKDAEFLIKYFNSDEMKVIIECITEIRKKRKELKSLFLRIHNKIDDMGEFEKRQLYNLIIMKEWRNEDRPQKKDYTEENFWELINWYIKWHKLENFELQHFKNVIIDEIE